MQKVVPSSCTACAKSGVYDANSTHLIVSDPLTICLPGEIHDNSTLRGGINAGVFTLILDKAQDMDTCMNTACQKRMGDLVLMIEKQCYMVTCFTSELCQVQQAVIEDGNFLRSLVATYKWIGE